MVGQTGDTAVVDVVRQKTGRRITFSKEAREKFLDPALSPASVARMVTLSLGGRISAESPWLPCKKKSSG